MKKKRVIALGFFDGVHIGHMALLNRCRSIAEKSALESAALTFSLHPDSLIFDRKAELLSTSAHRVNMLKRIGGVTDVLLLPFDEAMQHLPHRDFFDKFLINEYRASHLVAGESFRFGYKGLGNPENLTKMCSERNVGCDIIPDVKLDGETVSSTGIKELLKNGDIEKANRFLGHPHELHGIVIRGRGVGSKALVPTINLAVDPSVVHPPFGVYITRISVEGKLYPAVTNIGIRPTFSDGSGTSVETNAIGYSGDAYGKEVTLQFFRYLRPELKFKDVNALMAQIEKDIRSAMEYRPEN